MRSTDRTSASSLRIDRLASQNKTTLMNEINITSSSKLTHLINRNVINKSPPESSEKVQSKNTIVPAKVFFLKEEG